MSRRSRGRDPHGVDITHLAQLVERQAFNLVVVGSSPTVGVICLYGATGQRVRLLISRLWVQVPLQTVNFNNKVFIVIMYVILDI